jgi:RHS repeat-associated protein
MSAKNYFTADAISYSDYHPFGMLMPNRHGQDDDYRYGFNGMEKDDEVNENKGSSYTTHFRQYDTRIGRWLSVDPLETKYPEFSSYCSSLNNPIMLTDPRGDDVLLRGWKRRDKQKLVRELHQVTGLDLRVGMFGKLKYAKDKAGNPIVRKINTSQPTFSVTGRERLMEMIDDRGDVIHVTGKRREGSEYLGIMDQGDGKRHTSVNVDPKQAHDFKSGYKGDNENANKTSNSAMLFFHETDHAYAGSVDEHNIGNPIDNGFGDERASNGIYNGDGMTRFGGGTAQGSASSFVNIIRGEMGLKLRGAYSIKVGDKRVIPFVDKKMTSEQVGKALDSYKTGDTGDGNGDAIIVKPNSSSNSQSNSQRDYESNPKK